MTININCNVQNLTANILRKNTKKIHSSILNFINIHRVKQWQQPAIYVAHILLLGNEMVTDSNSSWLQQTCTKCKNSKTDPEFKININFSFKQIFKHYLSDLVLKKTLACRQLPPPHMHFVPVPLQSSLLEVCWRFQQLEVEAYLHGTASEV